MSNEAHPAVRLDLHSGCCPPRRIGVLTFHRCINYGSYWQAKCLVEGLKSLGHDAVILDHTSPLIDIAEWRVALRPTLPIPNAPGDSQQYACKVRKFLHEIAQLPLTEPLDLNVPQSWPRFDTIVVGSDEVWNLRHPWYAGVPAFFGIDLPADRVISYAASFGNYSCWEGIGSPWTDALSRLDATSVRDENSWWMLKNSLGVEVPTVLDPCLQFPPAIDASRQEPYAAVYGHNFTPEFADEVRVWARGRGLKLLSIGYRNDWADEQWLTAGPKEFASAIARSKAVATNFFHGCVFALLNEKPFACETSSYRSIKVRGLMEFIGGQAHLGWQGQMDQLLESPLEPAISVRLEELRRSSSQYLKGAIGGA